MRAPFFEEGGAEVPFENASPLKDKGPKFEVCTICLDNCRDDELNALFTACGHCFHVNCLATWILKKKKRTRQPHCPNCRAHLPEPAQAECLLLARHLATSPPLADESGEEDFDLPQPQVARWLDEEDFEGALELWT